VPDRVARAPEHYWGVFGFFHNKCCSKLSNKILKRMVYVHDETRLVDKVGDSDYKEANVDCDGDSQGSD